MKKTSIILLLIIFFTFLFYQTQKGTDFQVLEVISPTQIVVDLNNNNVKDADETITVKNIQSFSTKPNEAQSKLAQKLKFSEEDSLGLGFLAENFAKETLTAKKVKLKSKNSQIFVDNKNYSKMLINSGFAIKDDTKLTPELQKNIEKVRKLNLRIFNNKSHKYHKLNCKYGLMAHNAQIVPATQLPKDAKPCKFCLVKHKHYKKYKKWEKYKKHKYYDDVIPYVKSPATIYETNSIKMFLTDFTKVLKPSNACTTPVCRALVKEINSAQTSIDFAIYGYTKVPALQKALENAQARGVKVRFVYDLDSKGRNIYPDTIYLTKVLTNNRADATGAIMHDKFFIFDNKTVLTGSANISTTDMSGYNSNAIIIINSTKVANVFSKEFEQMYAGKFHKSKSKIKNKEDNVDSAEFQIYFAPKDKAITARIIPLINGAQKYIYIPAFLITQKGLSDSLIAASNRGVAVKIILDATNTHSGATKLKTLRQNGIQVKTENLAGKLHSKSIIIDDTYTIIGSMNFSRSGEGANDENLLIIKDRQIAVFYKTFFQYLWRRIPDKWLKYNARAESLDSIGSCTDKIDNDFDGKIDSADEGCKPTTFLKKGRKRL